jgi:hypothetical protein
MYRYNFSLAWMQKVDVIGEHDIVDGLVIAILVGASVANGFRYKDRHLDKLGFRHWLTSLFLFGVGVLIQKKNNSIII